MQIQTPHPYKLYTGGSDGKNFPGGAGTWAYTIDGKVTIEEVGIYRVNGFALGGHNGSNPQWTALGLKWSNFTGSDSGTVPMDLSTVSGLTILNGAVTGWASDGAIKGINTSDIYLSAREAIVRVTIPNTQIYLCAYIEAGAAVNARISIRCSAERIAFS